MKDSLIIIGCFIAGSIIGYIYDIQVIIENEISFYVLCALIFCVGFGIGHDPQTLSRFKNLDPRYMLLPLMTIFGSLGACIVVSLFLNERSMSECLAIGSGFGYYSLSSILITEAKGAELGTISLLANITREIIALGFAPLLVKYFGKFSLISVGGATTMDTTLPIILKYSGKELLILSIFHGFIVDLSVPFLVSFFISI